jgi:hypothetical protein
MVPWSNRPLRSFVAAAALGLLGVLAPSTARADLITPIGEATSGGTTLGSLVSGFPGSTSGTDYYAGLISYQLNGTAINGYCLTPLNPITAGVSYNANPVPVPPGTSPDFTNAGKVMSVAASSLSSTDPLAQTAAALAIWKLASYANDSTFNPANFGYKNVNGTALSSTDVATIVADYNADLAAASPNGTGTIEDAGANTGAPNQTLTGPPGSPAPPVVPEPASVMLLSLGFVGLGGARWWKRARPQEA